jgi:hypothetical protein
MNNSYYLNCHLSEEEFEVVIQKFSNIKIYKWERRCHECNALTPMITYFIPIDNIPNSPSFTLGDIKILDQQLSEDFPWIKEVNDYFINELLFTNTCINCGEYIHKLEWDDEVACDLNEIYFNGGNLEEKFEVVDQIYSLKEKDFLNLIRETTEVNIIRKPT